MLDTVSAAISEGGYQWLMLARQFEKAEVMVPTYSREGLPQVRQFLARNQKDGVRVRVLMGTGLARSRAARNDQLMNMWQQGIIRDPRLMAELMEVPHSTFAAPDARDVRLAANENIDMAKGVAVTPNSWDNHAIHLREHNDYRKTQEFLALESSVKEKFEYHCDQHEQMEEAALMRQAKLAQLAAAVQQPAPTDQPPQEAPAP
jgi:hypothetical protein